MNPRLDTMIVDDSKASIAVLQGDLQRHECINVVATTTDISKAGELIARHKPAVLFIDIEMPGKNGLDFVAEMKERTDHEILVIFYSAFEHYMIDALRLSAFDFLRKPYFPDELDEIIGRIQKRNETQPKQTQQEIPHSSSPTIGMQTETGIEMINVNEVVYFLYDSAVRTWQMFYSDQRVYNLRKNLKAKDILAIDTADYVQLSQNCIVNMRFVSSIENQSLRCQLAAPFDGAQLTVSRTYFPKLKEKLRII